MKPHFKKVFAFFWGMSLFTQSIFGCTASDEDATAEMVDVDGHQMFIWCVGDGPSTVILEIGIGEGASNGYWGTVPGEIKDSARICLYDRAGLGKSAPGPLPRDSMKIARELHTLLKNANLAPPYILVGHSMGGLHIRSFAEQFPAEVSAMVFVDPTPAELMTEPLSAEQLDNLTAAGASPGVLAEADGGIAASIDEWAALGPLPDVPVAVLTSSAPPAGAPSLDVERWEILRDYHRALADSVSDGVHTVATKSGHYIHLDEPYLVINAIKRMIYKFPEPGERI